jgi:hypothetical protein
LKQRHARWAFSVLWVCLGCPGPSPVRDGGSTGGSGSSSTGGGTAGAAARIRLANLAPLGTGIDVCSAVHGSGQFQGPLLASAGLSSGVGYADVSGYVSIPGGALDLRLVAAGGDCSQDLKGTSDLTDLPPLAAGAEFTVAEVLGSTPPTQIFADDSAAPDSQTAGLRFINASVHAPSLDLGSVQDGGFTPWITGAQFLAVGGTAQLYSLDANGYLAVPAVASVLLEVESQSKDLLDLSAPSGGGLSLNGGALYTLFALTGSPLAGLLCTDLGLLESGYTPCVLYPLPVIGGTTGGTTGGTGT